MLIGFLKTAPVFATAVHSKSCHTCPALPYLRGRCKQLKGTSTNILFERNFCVCVIRFTMMIQAWFMSEPLVTIWTSVRLTFHQCTIFGAHSSDFLAETVCDNPDILNCFREISCNYSSDLSAKITPHTRGKRMLYRRHELHGNEHSMVLISRRKLFSP